MNHKYFRIAVSQGPTELFPMPMAVKQSRRLMQAEVRIQFCTSASHSKQVKIVGRTKKGRF